MCVCVCECDREREREGETERETNLMCTSVEFSNVATAILLLHTKYFVCLD